jgi:hypothetical protein
MFSNLTLNTLHDMYPFSADYCNTWNDGWSLYFQPPRESRIGVEIVLHELHIYGDMFMAGCSFDSRQRERKEVVAVDKARLSSYPSPVSLPLHLAV